MKTVFISAKDYDKIKKGEEIEIVVEAKNRPPMPGRRISRRHLCAGPGPGGHGAGQRCAAGAKKGDGPFRDALGPVFAVRGADITGTGGSQDENWCSFDNLRGSGAPYIPGDRIGIRRGARGVLRPHGGA